MNDPICALCDGPMVIVEVRHRRNVTKHALCVACIRSLVKKPDAEQPSPRGLSIVRSSA